MIIGRLIFFCYAALVAYVSLRQGDSTVVEPYDKVAHAFTYAVFALLALPLVRQRRRVFYILSLIVLYSALLEFAQSYIPGRMMSAYDLLANVVGVAIGVVIGGALGKLSGNHSAAREPAANDPRP